MNRARSIIAQNYQTLIILILISLLLILFSKNKNNLRRLETTESFLIENYPEIAISNLKDSILFTRVNSDLVLSPFNDDSFCTIASISDDEFNFGILISKYSCGVCVDSIFSELHALASKLPFLQNLNILTDLPSPIDINVILKRENLDWPLFSLPELSVLLRGNTITIPILILWTKSRRIIGICGIDVRDMTSTENWLYCGKRVFEE